MTKTAIKQPISFNKIPTKLVPKFLLQNSIFLFSQPNFKVQPNHPIPPLNHATKTKLAKHPLFLINLPPVFSAAVCAVLFISDAFLLHIFFSTLLLRFAFHELGLQPSFRFTLAQTVKRLFFRSTLSLYSARTLCKHSYRAGCRHVTKMQ